MKKLSSLFVLILASSLVLSQNSNLSCGTPPLTPEQKAQLIQYKQVSNNFEMNTYRTAANCIPLKIHLVTEDDGSGTLDLAEVAKGIANLNYAFLPADINFYVCGQINYINSSDLFEFNGQGPDSDSDNEFAALGEVNNAFNVYVVNTITTSSGVAASGYAYFPFNNIASTRILMRKSVFAGPINGTLVHELGHSFSLPHTHNGTENSNTHPNAERIVRTGVDANCDTNGDTFCDTDADPRYSGPLFNSSTCTYTGNQMDDLGMVYTPPIDNIMSYFPDACGSPNFTNEQFASISAALAVRQGHTAYSLDCSAAVIPAVTDLAGNLNENNYQVEFTFTPNATALGYILERSSTSATTGFIAVIEAGAGMGETAINDPNAMANTKYWYRLKAINGLCGDYSNVVEVNVGLLYCLSEYQNNGAVSPGGCDLTPVYLDDFAVTNSSPAFSNNSTGCSTDGMDSPINFGNFKSTTPEINVLADGTTAYNFTTGGPNINFVGVFADLNRDGDFDDANEDLYINPSAGVGVAGGSFTIPTTATLGLTTLRVRVSNAVAITGACSYTAFGETEDYNLKILSPLDVANGLVNCTAVSASTVSGMGSFNLLDVGGDIVAVISPNGNNLGNVTIDYRVDNSLITSGTYDIIPRYWAINCDGPDCMTPNFTSGNVDVSLFVKESEWNSFVAATSSTEAPSSINILHYTGAVEDCDPTNNLSSGYETLLANTQNTFSQFPALSGDHLRYDFTVGHFSEFSMSLNTGILPIELISFNAVREQDHVLLTWQTATETNNDYFTIEKSANGTTWEIVNQIPGAGNSNTTITYSELDTQPYPGISYYRLKQTDFDGLYSYSSIEAVHMNLTETIIVYPNPTTTSIKLLGDIELGENFTIMDVTGRLWMSQKLNSKTIDLTNLPSGMYFISIVGKKTRHVAKVVKY